MTIITIPKRVTNGKELIIIPKKDWERILRIAKRKTYQAELEKGLDEALEEVRKGKIKGPFSNVDDLIRDLEK